LEDQKYNLDTLKYESRQSGWLNESSNALVHCVQLLCS
jgi:hypothetical protein